MEASRRGASPSPSPSPGASNLAGEKASNSSLEGFLLPEGPAGSFLQPIPGAARVFASAGHKLAPTASSSPSAVIRPTCSRPPTGRACMNTAQPGAGGVSSPDFVAGDRRSMEGRPEHKRRRFAEGAPTVANPATPSTSMALLHPKLEWEQEGVHRPHPKQPEKSPPPPLKQEEDEVPPMVPLPLKQEREDIPHVAAPAPKGGKPWPHKLRRIARDRMFTHFPPGVPTKIGDESNLKIAATELKRRMGNNENLDHLTGSQQVSMLLQLGNLPQRSPVFLMDRFSDYCDGHPMAHPPPPPPPPQP